MTTKLRKMIPVLAAVAAFMLVAASGAQAKLVELTGTSTVTPSPQATKFLADNGVSVAATGAATFEEGAFVFPIAGGFGNTRTFSGLLAHNGGLKFTREDRSFVVRQFVAVRVRGASVLLAQLPGLRGGCGHLKSALTRFGVTLKGAPRKHPKAHRALVRAARNYCAGGRVIVLARLTNLGKDVTYNGALLTADLRLSAGAAKLINRLAGKKAVKAGALLGSAESRAIVVN